VTIHTNTTIGGGTTGIAGDPSTDEGTIFVSVKHRSGFVGDPTGDSDMTTGSKHD